MPIAACPQEDDDDVSRGTAGEIVMTEDRGEAARSDTRVDEDSSGGGRGGEARGEGATRVHCMRESPPRQDVTRTLLNGILNGVSPSYRIDPIPSHRIPSSPSHPMARTLLNGDLNGVSGTAAT